MRKIACTIALALAVTSAHADTVTIAATDRGFYNVAGRHDPDNTNYITGNVFGTLSRSFFVFDLSGLGAGKRITSARVRFPFSSGIANPGGPDGFETLGLFALTTPVAQLTAGGMGLTGIYDDLGDGMLLGQGDIYPFRAGDHFADFNTAGLAELNGTQGLFAIGGALLSLNPAVSAEYVFGGTGGFAFTPQLILQTRDVPAPGALALFGLGLLALAGRRR